MDEIPTVNFCEMVKNPRRYFDKTIRLTATYEPADEAQYLSDVGCVLSYDYQIGISYFIRSEEQRKIDLLANYKGTYPARVTIVGVLRNESMRAFAWYRYRFDIIRFEKILPEDESGRINGYNGTLKEGLTYRAMMRGGGESNGGGSAGLTFAFFPLHILPHQTARVEWINLKDFPALKLRAREQRQIVFKVVSDKTIQISEQRWNRTLRCRIVIVE